MIFDAHTHYHNYEQLGEGVRLSPAEFVAALDHHGIAQAAVSNPFCLETDFIAGNRLVFDLMEQHAGRVKGVVALHPLFLEESSALLEEGLRRGVRGIKLHTDLSHLPYDGPEHLRLVEAVSRSGLPITLHTSPASLPNALRLAQAFPETTFLFGHVGGLGFRQMLAGMAPLENTYADLCGNVFLYGFVEEITGALGDERVLFSSDFPYATPAVMLGMVERASLPEISKERLLGLNAQRIFLS